MLYDRSTDFRTTVVSYCQFAFDCEKAPLKLSERTLRKEWGEIEYHYDFLSLVLMELGKVSSLAWEFDQYGELIPVAKKELEEGLDRLSGAISWWQSFLKA